MSHFARIFPHIIIFWQSLLLQNYTSWIFPEMIGLYQGASAKLASIWIINISVLLRCKSNLVFDLSDIHH